ncbi:MAG: outer membrane lipoprotein carrier protein LolA [Prevotella sp.]|nr:outer membrane lipoprotein carrier protein LolA [Candidatus Prevotella equi]
MKKILMTMVMALVCVMTFAQNADYKKAVAKYKSVNTLTATATRTTHKNAVAKDQVVSGTLYVKGSDKVLIENGKDLLLMNGSKFTFKKGPVKASTNSNTNVQYKTFHDVLESIFNGGQTDISKNSDVDIAKKGANVVVTITPKAGNKKMMFSSFVLTIDTKAQELRSIRLVQKGGYTDYTFSNFKLGASVSDAKF